MPRTSKQINGRAPETLQRRTKINWRLTVTLVALAIWFLFGMYHTVKPLPEGLSFAGPPRASDGLKFIADLSWIDENGNRQVDQRIFESMLSMVSAARRLIVVDVFLYNDFQGTVPETTRLMSAEFTNALLAQKNRFPDIEIIVITDPLNTLYDSLSSAYFTALRNAGVRVIETDLDRLRDSNPLYSAAWRLLARPFGTAAAATLPNPVGPGHVSIRSYLKLLNFKANHRKIIVADDGGDLVGLVTSANIHDASSAHRNVAIQFQGDAALDLLETEIAVIRLVDENYAVTFERTTTISNEALDGKTTIRVVTEGKIGDAVIAAVESADNGDSIDMMMFYLSDRRVIEALKNAHDRGAHVRVLLDANHDAFGRSKNGIPNRPVAWELLDHGIEIRWCFSKGEQCHTKLVQVHQATGNSTRISHVET